MKIETKNRLLDFIFGTFIACIPFAPEFKLFGAWITAIDILVFTIVIVWAAALLFNKRYFHRQKFPMLVPLCLLLLTFLISGINAVNQQLVIKEFLKYVFLFPLFFVLVNNISRNVVLKSASLISYSLSVLSFWFLIDFFLGHVDPTARLWHRKILSEMQLNAFGTQLAVAIPFSLYLFFHSFSYIKKTTSIVCFFLQLTALMLTYSRANWIAFSIVLILILFYEFKVKGIVGVALLLVLPFLVITTFYPSLGLNSRLASTFNSQESSIVSRKDHIKTAISFIKRYPLTGIGLGNFKQASQKYYHKDLTEMVHNMFLQFGAETGLISMLLLASILAISFYTVILSTQRNTGDASYNVLLLYAAMSFLGLIISCQFGDPFVRGIKEYFILLLAFCYKQDPL